MEKIRKEKHTGRKGCGLHIMFRLWIEGVSPEFQKEEHVNDLYVQVSLECSRASRLTWQGQAVKGYAIWLVRRVD